MIDRTKELKDVVDGRATWESPEPEEDMVIVDMTKLAEEDAEENKAVQEFQAECKNIESMIEAMEERMDALEQQYGHSLDVTSAEKVKAVKDRIRQLIAETRRFAASTRAALSTMEQQTHDIKKQAEVEASETEGKSALIRMREQQHAYLTNRFASVLRDWEQIRDDYRRSCVERLARQIRIVNPNMSEKQVEQMLSKQEVETTEIFKTDWLLTKAQRAQLESVYAEVYETHKEIRELELEFQELHQTFVDTATLVSQQDELLDIIQLQVRNATEYVGKGRGHLAKAMKYQAKGRKKIVQIIVVCICIIGVVALLGFVGGKFLVPTLIAQAKKASGG